MLSPEAKAVEAAVVQVSAATGVVVAAVQTVQSPFRQRLVSVVVELQSELSTQLETQTPVTAGATIVQVLDPMQSAGAEQTDV